MSGDNGESQENTTSFSAMSRNGLTATPGDDDDDGRNRSMEPLRSWVASPAHVGASCWETDSMTPMTSRPHFCKRQHTIDDSELHLDSRRMVSPVGRRRPRPHSIGSVAEAYELERTPSYLLVPSMTHTGSVTMTTPAVVPGKDKANDAPLGKNEDEAFGEESETLSEDHMPRLTTRSPIYISIMYGIINAVIVLPVLMSFGAIIYRDPSFQPYMPTLIKLTVISGMVHQLAFTTLSTLPFCVGQVQDAGLIFLSSMARQIVLATHGQQDETLLATATVGLSLGTILLGVCLVGVGRLGWAQTVQMLPTCVVGGYLAYIGWFCGISGVGLMMVSPRDDTHGWWNMVLHMTDDDWLHVIPGIVGGVWIYTSVRHFRHMAALPICIGLLLVAFYAVLGWTNTSLEQATLDGWIRSTDAKPAPWYHAWAYMRFDKVQWSVIPSLLLTELSMIMVVALSSSLDVAAIELEVKRPLDYNHELTTVGWANVLSGCTGGYTGSYIFSQSIFNLRAGISDRLAGYALAACQFIVVVLPFDILSVVPNFFFGSLLSMICIDLLWEWLWDVRLRVTQSEYAIAWATFGMVQLWGVEYGILGGVAVYSVCWYLLGWNVGPAGVVEASEAIPSEQERLVVEHKNDAPYGSILA